MTGLILYISGFILGAFASFLILKASRINEAFKQGRTYQIILAYILIGIISGHIIGEIFYRIYSFI